METKRASWASNLGFLMAAIGSAVGLGNIWGFPYKMGKSGGFAYLIAAIQLCIKQLCIINRPHTDNRSQRGLSCHLTDRKSTRLNSSH